MRALVTGCTGFVGSALVEELSRRGIDVLGLRRETSPQDAVEGLIFTPAIGDILDVASLRQAMEGVDWVFHVAAVSDHRHTAPEVILKVNVDGSRNVFQAALDAGVRRLIFTSSSAALGVPRLDKKLLDESDTFNLQPHEFPYGYSKHRSEEILAEYVARGLDAVTVLPSAVMGPRDLRFISGELIVQALKSSIPAVPKGGLNYIDVRDCVAGQIAAAEAGETGERYLLSGHNMTHRESMEILHEVLGTRVPRFDMPGWLVSTLAESVGILTRVGFHLPIYREVLRLAKEYLYYDNSKATSKLGLRTRPFAESVRDAYQWYADRGYLEKRGIPVAPAITRIS